MKVTLRVLVVLFIAALLTLGGLPARARQSGGHYFPQTGHNVTGEFWAYYEGVPDAALIFGLPITEQFTTADGSDLTVQYFQKVRFELHPDEPQGRRVVLTDLVSRVYEAGAPSINVTTPGACRTLNGFGICYDFLTFFDQYGGLDRFGNPLSAFEFQPDGRLVQYFERARFEWHPDLPPGQKVTLSDYGWIYASANEDPSRLNSASPLNNIPIQVTAPLSLRVSAFVARTVTLPTDTQKVFVIVHDQALSPVFGASGTVTVHLANGEVLVYPIETAANGIAVVPALRFSHQAPGSLIVLDVEVDYQGLRDSTTTSFLIWR